jgi:hypothetical protein
MTNSERPPQGETTEPEAEGGDRHREGARRLVERLMREGVRRAVEKGVERITETPEDLRNLVQELKLPREITALLFQQIDETKNGLYRAVARELRDFLDQTNIADEITRALTTLSFEIKTEIRFIPNDQRLDDKGPPKPVKPEVKASVRVKDERDRAETAAPRDSKEPKDTKDPSD